jgi:hypothetical protein
MKPTHLLRFSIPALALLFAALLIGPACMLRMGGTDQTYLPVLIRSQ